MFKTKTPKSFRWHIASALARAAFVFALVAGVAYVWSNVPTDIEIPTGAGVMDTRPDAAGSPAAVLDRMGDDCWQGEAPADVEIPGHVVFSKGASGAMVGGSKMVGQALDQIFNGQDFGLRIHAFCR